MSFLGYKFIFNNVLSDKFGLIITSINDSGTESNTLIPSINFVTKQIPNNPKFYHLGTFQNTPLSFIIDFYSESPIYAYKREQIAAWLGADGQYKKLQILQDDMLSLYYNCYFSDIKWNSIMNSPYGFTANVICDAPFAWKNVDVFKKDNPYTLDQNKIYPSTTEFTIFNTSADFTPIIPSIRIELADNNNHFKITNLSNNNKFMSFDKLQNGEVISIDNKMIMESITNPNKIIVDNFSGSMIQIVRGKNNFRIDGAIKNIIVKYQIGRKIG